MTPEEEILALFGAQAAEVRGIAPECLAHLFHKHAGTGEGEPRESA